MGCWRFQRLYLLGTNINVIIMPAANASHPAINAPDPADAKFAILSPANTSPDSTCPAPPRPSMWYRRGDCRHLYPTFARRTVNITSAHYRRRACHKSLTLCIAKTILSPSNGILLRNYSGLARPVARKMTMIYLLPARRRYDRMLRTSTTVVGDEEVNSRLVRAAIQTSQF